MDNRNVYKSADELKISDWERDGLIAIACALSRDEIELDMRFPMCGSVGCIGGHIATNVGIDPGLYVSSLMPGSKRGNSGLSRLYYPGPDNLCVPYPGWKASSQQAAQAVINFLVTGEAQWDAVMGLA